MLGHLGKEPVLVGDNFGGMSASFLKKAVPTFSFSNLDLNLGESLVKM